MENNEEFSIYNINLLINFIKNNFIQIILFILVFVIIYVVDHITNINAAIFAMPSPIPGVSAIQPKSQIKIPKGKRIKK